MENTEFSLPEYSAKPQFNQTATTEQDWKTIGIWAKFFGIYGFVTFGIGLLGVFYLAYILYDAYISNPFFKMMLNTRVYTFLGVMVLLMGTSLTCTFLGSRYHLRFSQKIKIALERRDQQVLTEAWSDMRLAWKTYGVYLLASLVAYMLILIWQG